MWFLSLYELKEPLTRDSTSDHISGPARGFGYTVSRAILLQVHGIFGQNSGIKYSVFPEF